MSLAAELVVVMGYVDRYPVVAVTAADGLYREAVLVAGSLYPTAQECGHGRVFPERAYKESNNRAPTALRKGAQRLSDDAAERIKTDVIARLEAMR